MFSKALTALAAAATAVALAAPAQAAPSDSPEQCVTDGAAGSAYRVGINCRVVEVDGHPRKYIVYVPSRAPVTGPRAPVVFMFHGSTGSGEQFLRISGWREQADATGLVAVFPTGLRYRVLESGRLSTKWNSYDLASEVDLGERPRGYPEGSPWPADDIGFVDAMVSDLQAELPIDRHRIYASGFSNGANFTARLAMERSSRLAAVAYSGGGLNVVQSPARPIPMYGAVGTLDDRVLEKTGLTELPLDPVELLSVPLLSSGIDTHLVSLGLDRGDFGASSARHATSFRWPATGSGPDGALFRFSVLGGLRHNYPNDRNNPAGFQAAPEFWDFFRAHPLP
ncbi:MAG: PHB depolymerase family esterase [Thermoleophilaceae bacterium]